MNAFYLLLGSEGALADRALAKLQAEFKEESAEITTIDASDALVGDIADALAPSLFSERRALIIKDLQDLPEDSKAEITRYLDHIDPTMTVVFVHKGGVKGKALLDAIKKAKPLLRQQTADPDKAFLVRNAELRINRRTIEIGRDPALPDAFGD